MIPEKSHLEAKSFYTESESLKYKKSNHYIKTQCNILDYILNDLLIIQKDNSKYNNIKTVLDLGIGCNIYNEVYKEHSQLNIIGIDISKPMLLNNEGNNSLILYDIKNKLPLQPGSIDYIISISCIQWLFNDINFYFIKNLFNSIINILKRNGIGIFQFYFTDNSLNSEKKNEKNQLYFLIKVLKNISINFKLITDSKLKKRKIFLILWMNENKFEEIINKNSCFDLLKTPIQSFKKNKLKKREGIKEFISRKKEKSKSKGIKVPNDSKFSGRKRRRF